MWVQFPDIVVAHRLPAQRISGLKVDWKLIRARLKQGLGEFASTGLRWSYFVIAGLILTGVVLNIVLAHGWWVWPFVFVAGMMTMIHEAAERNGQGIPPLHGYALLFSAIGLWVLIAMILTWVGPLMLLAVPPLLYFGTRIFLKNHKRMKQIAQRRADGCCIFCGEPFVPGYVLCGGCGLEPGLNPDKPVEIGSVSSAKQQRARAALTPEAPTASVKRKEEALMGRRPRQNQNLRKK